MRNSPKNLDGPVLEFRTFKLLSGTAERFDRLANDEATPRQEQLGIEVVAAFASLQDGEHYIVIRRFASEAERARQETLFYGSDAWANGPRDAVLALIESYHSVVVPIEGAHADALRAALETADGQC
jgi:NIPSNAP